MFWLGVTSSALAATTYAGYTFFASGSKAYLYDANSKTVHTWQASGSAQTCAYLLSDGSALFPIQNTSCSTPAHNGAYPSGRFQKISWDGAILWDYYFCDSTARAGYDVEPMPNGNILIPADASNVSKIFEVQPTGTNTGTVVWSYTLPTNLTASTTYINSVSYNPDLDQILVDLQDPQRKLVVINHNGAGSVLFTYLVGASGRVHAAAWVTRYFLGTTNLLPDADFAAMRTNNLLVVYNGGDKATEVSMTSSSTVRSLSYAFDDHEGSIQRLPNGNTLVTPGNSKTITELDDSGATVATLTAPASIQRAYRYGYAFPGVARLATNATGSGSAAFSNAAACSPVAVTYTCSNGVLQGATQMFAHLGYKGWTQVFPTQKMTKVATNQWRLTTTPPPDVGQLNVVFHNGAGTWDLNGGTNWNFALNVCASPAIVPGLAITNPPGTVSVAAATATYAVQGTATGLVGALIWTNGLNGATGTLPVASAWNIASVPLAVGTNRITVGGTNGTSAATNAADGGANFVYNDGWTTNDNGGFGFGAWQVYASSTNTSLNGRFMATGAVVSIGTPAWGLYANSTNLSEAKRALGSALVSGQTFSVRFDNGSVNSGSGVGVALQNAGGETLWQFYVNGGDAFYTLNGTLTDIAKTTNGLDVAVTLSGSTSFVARITPLGGTTYAYAGNFAAATNMAASVFRAWNWNAGAGSVYDFYFNNLQIVAANADSAFSAATAIIRPQAIVSNALTVVSPYDSPNPAGTSMHAAGTLVTGRVDRYETHAGAVQYENAGWTLAGGTATNGATEGTTTNVTLALTNDATLTWLWKTNYWLATATNGNGTLDFGGGAPGLVPSTASVTVAATAAPGWHFAAWSGDTDGCAIAEMQLTAPMVQTRALAATFAIDRHTLTVESPYGSPNPAGTTIQDHGAIVAGYVDQYETHAGAVQYENAGWSLAGGAATNGATEGTTTNVVLALTNDATLTWLWKTNYWLATATNGKGRLDCNGGAPGWVPSTGSVTIAASADPDWHFAGWGGDTDGCAIAAAQLTAPMAQARTIFGIF